MKKFFEILKKIGNAILLILGCDCYTREEAVDNGICDFSGQGRNKYGR